MRQKDKHANGLMSFFRCGLALALVLTVMADDALAASFSERRADRRAERAEAAAKKQEVPLTPETFRHTLTLDGEEGSVLSYTLSENVHKGLRQFSFSDLCVFDADGTPVPFQLRSSGRTTESLTVLTDVPHFVWQPEKPDVGTPGSMDIEINMQGGIVRIKGQSDAPPRPGPVSYILDLKAFLDAVTNPAAKDGTAFTAEDVRERKLVVRMAGDGAFLTSVTMRTSADLAQWRPVGSTQVVARMRQGEMTMERDTLALPVHLERYALLQFSDSEAPAAAFSASAVFDKTREEMRESILPGGISANKRAVSYTLPGRFPLTAIGFDMPQADMMAVRLMGADDPAKPYRQYASGFIYRLEKNGATLTGEPFPVESSRRHWNLLAAGDIPFATPPGMRIHWRPQELLFLARGKGPWTLAYGRDTPVQASSLPLLAQGDVKPAREIAASAPPDAGNVPPPVERNQGQWLLWAVLILAVVFLSGVTVWLLRSMKR